MGTTKSELPTAGDGPSAGPSGRPGERPGGRVLLLRHCGLLSLALLALFLVLGPLAYGITGSMGVVAAAAALAICLVCGLLSVVITEPFRQPRYVLHHLVLSTGLRMGIPLMLLMVIYLRPGPMTEAGFVYYLLAFYMVTLLVEAGLTVQSQKVGANGPAKAS